jgi:hypothetical protein
MATRRRVFAPICAVGLFLVTSILPIWHTWYFDEYEGLGDSQSFWIMLTSLPDAVRWVGFYEVAVVYYAENWILVAIILTAGWLFGHAWLWIARHLTPPAGVGGGSAKKGGPVSGPIYETENRKARKQP